jgi:CRP-like cAMP-binding protein
MTTPARPDTSTVLPDERHIRQGEFIFRQGEVGNEMFVIGDGSVRLVISTEDGHESDIGVFGKGEFFGELSLMSAAPRSASAIAAEDSVLLVVTRDVFSMMVQDDLDIVARMMGEQGRRLSRANEPITQLTQQLGRVRVAAHCLRHLLDGAAGPASFDAAKLVSEVGLPLQAVTSTITLLAQEGIGALENGTWKLASGDVVRLSDAILRESDVE